MQNYAKAFDSMLGVCNRIKTIFENHLKHPLITNFSYNELRQNGEFIVLNSDESFFDSIITHDFCLEMPDAILKTHKAPGFYLLDADEPARKKYQAFVNLANKFGYGHTLRLIQIGHSTKNGYFIRRIGLEASVGHYEINHYYMNNSMLLWNLIANIITEIDVLMGEVLPIDSEIDSSRIQKYLACNNKCISTETSEKRVCEAHLTAREKQIIECLERGMTAEESAISLCISKRTVENHFEKLRIKFGCSSKYAVLKKLQRC